jgi:hypothetical protein
MSPSLTLLIFIPETHTVEDVLGALGGLRWEVLFVIEKIADESLSFRVGSAEENT